MINVYWKSGVPKEAITAVIVGVRRFARLVSFPRSNIAICGVDKEMDRHAKIIPKVRSMFDGWSMDLYMNRRNNDVNIYITDERLCDGDGKYCLGITVGINVVVSTSSVKNLSSLAELTMHELGHAHGMTNAQRIDTESSYGYHCTRPNCLMQQSYGVDAFERRVPECRRHGWFCNTCISEARASNERKGWYQLPPLPPRKASPPPLPRRR